MDEIEPLDLNMEDYGLPRRETVAEPRPQRPQAAINAEAEPRGNQAPKPRAPRKPIPSQEPQKPRPKAREPQPQTPKEPVFNRFMRFFRSQSTHIALAVVLLVFSVVWLIVAINYLKNGPIDQSLVSENSIAASAEAAEGVANAGGAIGAKFAHILFVDGLGIGAFVLVIYTTVLGLSLLGLMRCRFWAFSFKCLFTAVALSIITGLFTYNAETTFHWGGNHGRYVNQWLMHMGDSLIAYGVSIVLIGLLAVLYLTQLKSFYNNVSGRIAKTRAAMAEAAEKARREKAEMAEVPIEAPQEPQPATEAPTSAPAPAAKGPENDGFDIDSADDEPEPEPAPAPDNKIEFEISSSAPQPSQPSQLPHPVAVQNPEPEFTIQIANETATQPAPDPSEAVSQPNLEPFNVRDSLSRYAFPTPDLLIDRPTTISTDKEEQEENKNMIVNTLASYGVGISKITATIGPTITLYEIVPAEGVRIAQIKRLEDDIALSLEALGIRIIAPIPGKGTIGIEVPNRNPQTVSMSTVINSPAFRSCNMRLPMALGSTINNEIFIADLAKMPHLLVAGATGQGKSVGLNCIIASLLYKKHPGELKFVLIDPKMVEFSLYSRLEHHFLAKLPEEEDAIVTDPNKALATLASLCVEMDARYDLLKTASVRTVEEYNTKYNERKLNPENGHRYLPYIVIIVDEFADLIMVAGKDITTYIARIAQKARAVGMHMIIATQRPSTDIITGMIKANFPGRIAFRVAQMVDSKTILDRPGANRLIGRGDMLFSHNSMIERVQCAFIDTPEVEALVDFIDDQMGYATAYMLPDPPSEGGAAKMPGAVDLSKRDEMFDDCARFIVQNSTASTSSLQRRFGIGYNKAGKIMDQLEAAGIVGPADGQKPRAVLVDFTAIEDILRAL